MGPLKEKQKFPFVIPTDLRVETEYQVFSDPGSEWGTLMVPERKNLFPGGIRVAIFGSTTAGHLVLETLLRFNARYPGLIDLKAVATDDIRDPRARIGIRKRIWKYYTSKEQKALMDLVVNTALNHGIPCFTGGIKNDFFKGLLREWDPELIIMCCFGQQVDRFTYEYPAYGMYNFHPSDLVSNIGAGAKPFEMTIREGRTTSHMILHRVSEIIDAGPIVGISPHINITRRDGTYPHSFLVLQEKIPSICGWMVYGLLLTLLRNLESGKKGFVDGIDFDAMIPGPIKTELMKPVFHDPGRIRKLPFPV